MVNLPEFSLLRSKRFWSALLGTLTIVVSTLDPRLEPHLNIIAPAILGIVGLLVGGYSVTEISEQKYQIKK